MTGGSRCGIETLIASQLCLVMIAAVTTIIFSGNPTASAFPTAPHGGHEKGSGEQIPSESAGAFVAVPPTQVINTLKGIGVPKRPLKAGETLRFKIAGLDEVPITGVGAIGLDVTTYGAEAAGWLSVYADGTKVRPVSARFGVKQLSTDVAISRISDDGFVDFTNQSSGNLHLNVIPTGYFLGGTPTNDGAFGAVPPVQVLNTKQGVGVPAGPVRPGKTVTLKVAGVDSIPKVGVVAVTVTMTVVKPEGRRIAIVSSLRDPRRHGASASTRVRR